MIRLQILIPAIVTILIAVACNQSSTLDLITPNSGASVYHEEVLLQWTTDEDGPYMLQIALDSNYTDIHTDTTINMRQIIIPQLLPNTQYFWKVSTTKLEANSDFNTHNILLNISNFSGIAVVREYVQEPMAGIGFDTTYNELIEFSYNEDELTISSEFDSFTSVYELGGYNFVKKGVTYNEGGGGSNFRHLEYFYDNDSIFIRRHRGGIAGGRRWTTSIKK